MNDFLFLIVVAFFMASTAVFVSIFNLILSTYEIAPTWVDCVLVVVLCLGASLFESLFETLVERSQLHDEVAK